MKTLNAILQELRREEYMGEDGLLHCGRCRKPLQMRLSMGDETRTVRCNCSCLERETSQWRERQRVQEEMDRFDRIRSAAIADPALRKCTFAASQYDSAALQYARNYVSQWPQALEKGAGLLFWGPCGTGKTYLAACIANALADQGVPVLMTSFGRMLGSLPGPASGEQTAVIDRWMQHPLLIVDDLGAERETAYAADLVYQIVDARYRSGKPMVLTTNLTMKELEDPECLEKKRIYDRILERCTPVRVEGQKIRSIKREENRDFARSCLKKGQEEAGKRKVAS